MWSQIPSLWLVILALQGYTSNRQKVLSIVEAQQGIQLYLVFSSSLIIHARADFFFNHQKTQYTQTGML